MCWCCRKIPVQPSWLRRRQKRAFFVMQPMTSPELLKRGGFGPCSPQTDIRQRYRRSTLGQFWITASMAILITALGIIYSAIFHQPIAFYLPYVAASFVIWSFITSITIEGCATFLEAAGYARQLSVPLSAYALRTLFRSLFILAHNLVILPVVWLIFAVPLGWSSLWAIAGVILIILNGLWMVLLLGTLCARFRDLPQIVTSLVQILFFMTPVFFLPEQVPAKLRSILQR